MINLTFICVTYIFAIIRSHELFCPSQFAFSEKQTPRQIHILRESALQAQHVEEGAAGSRSGQREKLCVTQAPEHTHLTSQKLWSYNGLYW